MIGKSWGVLVSLWMLSFFVGCASHATPLPTAGAPTNFQECVEQRGRILKSFPPQCVSSDGRTFTQEVSQGQKPRREGFCKNTCGNGSCEEMVCMALGCPCAETAETCPQDCK